MLKSKRKKVIDVIKTSSAILVIAVLIAVGSGNFGAPPPPPPPPPPAPTITVGRTPQPEEGQPFHFSGVVKLVNLEGQYFLLVDHPVRNPKDLETRSIELINVRPFEYKGQTLYPVVLKSTPTEVQEVGFEEIQPYQSVSAGGVVRGAAEGEAVWELDAAQVQITEEHYLQRKEQTNGFTIVITSVNGNWLTADRSLLKNQRQVKIMPGCQIVTRNNQAKEAPFQGELDGKRATILVSTRPDRDFLYTYRISVMP